MIHLIEVMAFINPLNVAKLLFEDYNKEDLPLTQVSDREKDLKEKIKTIITEYRNCGNIDVEIDEDLILAEDEYDCNFDENNNTEEIQKFNEEVNIEYKKGGRILEP